MRKFIIISVFLIIAFLTADVLYYNVGVYTEKKGEHDVVVKVVEDQMYMAEDSSIFEIKGVNLGSGIPGHFSTEYAIDKDTYLRWFELISQMSANTIRVYTILNADFYEAFYEYNINNPEPLYLIHGIWLDDYYQNANVHAFSEELIEPYIEESKDVVDVLHGRKKFYIDNEFGYEHYNHDISDWVIGYIMGVEWESSLVSYTNIYKEDMADYSGEYFYTAEDAEPFEAFLAYTADEMIKYETSKYSDQKMVAFSNWPTTDPFEYDYTISRNFTKVANVDTENILTTDKNIAKAFASYHIYPYFPDYLSYSEGYEDLVDKSGEVNTYYAYLKQINDHHTMPVVISEFGIPASRGMAREEDSQGRNQGFMDETQQAEAILSCYEDIKEAGISGAVVFSWQDEWFKRTWNTRYAVDLDKAAYWSDYQTNEQYFGLMAFDPGETQSIVYVDEDISDWNEEDVIFSQSSSSISAKYDNRYLYILASTDDFEETEKMYISLDITPNSGATSSQEYDISFERPVDFIVAIDGKDNSRIVVQERYDSLYAMYGEKTLGVEPFENPPQPDSTMFNEIHLRIQSADFLRDSFVNDNKLIETYETGLLRYGNSNPKSENYDSLADMAFYGNFVEVKIPWQMLNFSNPAQMEIHDDYYEVYGIEAMRINKIHIGVGNGSEEIDGAELRMDGWKNNVSYHERLKESYYVLKDYWSDD